MTAELKFRYYGPDGAQRSGLYLDDRWL